MNCSRCVTATALLQGMPPVSCSSRLHMAIVASGHGHDHQGRALADVWVVIGGNHQTRQQSRREQLVTPKLQVLMALEIAYTVTACLKGRAMSCRPPPLSSNGTEASWRHGWRTSSERRSTQDCASRPASRSNQRQQSLCAPFFASNVACSPPAVADRFLLATAAPRQMIFSAHSGPSLLPDRMLTAIIVNNLTQSAANSSRRPTEQTRPTRRRWKPSWRRCAPA